MSWFFGIKRTSENFELYLTTDEGSTLVCSGQSVAQLQEIATSMWYDIVEKESGHRKNSCALKDGPVWIDGHEVSLEDYEAV